MSLDFKFALPDVLNYAESKPNDIGSYTEISVVTPATGSAAINLGDYFIINIPRCGSDSVLDPQGSYLRFRLKNSAAAADAVLSGSCDCLFSRIEICHNNQVIELIDNYDLLSSLLLDTQVNAVDRSQGLSVTKGCNATVGNMTGQTITHGAGNAKYYTTTLLSGVVGSLARTYIPLFALAGNLSIRITTNPAGKALTWPAADSDITGGVTLDFIEFHANIVHLKPKILEMIAQPSYQIYTESYSNFQSSALKSTSTLIEQLVPFHYISLKTIFVIMRLTTQLSTYNQYLTSKCSFDIADYTFRVGSRNIPPTRVKCKPTNFIEPFEELKRSFHAPGNALVTMGCHDVASYGANPHSTSGDNSFIIGSELESYAGKSSELISGLDTSSTDVYWSATFTDNTTVTADALTDFYAHYDLILNIVDGQMSAAF